MTQSRQYSKDELAAISKADWFRLQGHTFSATVKSLETIYAGKFSYMELQDLANVLTWSEKT